jgi:hypothetical protein
MRRLLVHALVSTSATPDALEALGFPDKLPFGLESSLLLGLRDNLELVQAVQRMCCIDEFRVVREVVLGPQFLRSEHFA